MTEVEIILADLEKGGRLTLEQAIVLYEQADLLTLANAARKKKEEKSGKNVYFNVNRHINLTNICVSECPFCAFSCKEDAKQAYVLEVEDVERIVQKTMKTMPDLTEVHMVSALHPKKPYSYYIEVVRAVKKHLPDVHLKAFTPVEIVHFAKISGQSIEEVLRQLQKAGLDSLPGGGAEILDDTIRKEICPDKATTEEWITVMKTAHKLGILTNATMLYGHIETTRQRLQHLFTLRDIQDETGGFQAFVSFPFHPKNTKFEGIQPATSWENLRMIAMARLILDNFDHIKAFWMMLTMPVAQLSLAFGVDDLDGTVGQERIIHAAGAQTKTGITKEEIMRIVAETGYQAVERDTFYQPIAKG
ncbi:MAG: aminofutalosine synthase MqnE [Selenomonadales bacterium]|nr:aminofutalosine synthase MqnE [Selenomonadales bacterium]